MITVTSRLWTWLERIHTGRTRRYLTQHSAPRAAAVTTRAIAKMREEFAAEDAAWEAATRPDRQRDPSEPREGGKEGTDGESGSRAYSDATERAWWGVDVDGRTP